MYSFRLPGTTVFSISLDRAGLFPSYSVSPLLSLSLTIILEFFHLSLTHTTTCLYLHAHMYTHHHTPHTITPHPTPSHTIPYNSSWWSQVEEGPPDAIFGLVEAHKKDPRPNKVTLAIGAYRDDKGRPFVLPTVKKVLIHR